MTEPLITDQYDGPQCLGTDGRPCHGPRNCEPCGLGSPAAASPTQQGVIERALTNLIPGANASALTVKVSEWLPEGGQSAGQPVALADLAARYSPAHGYATITVRSDQVELGDVADHTDGLVVVTEITRRNYTWSVAGHNTGLPYRMPNPEPGARPRTVERPLLQRDITGHEKVRVRRPASAWHRLAGHTKKVASHNPVKRGWFTANDGWTAGCSCGWTAATVCTSTEYARSAVDKHRALVITQQHRDAAPGLADIERLEAALGDVLPWRWDHGAQAQLHGLTTARARERLAPWAEVLSVDIEVMPATAYGLPGEFYLWVDSRSGSGPRLDIRAYPTDGG